MEAPTNEASHIRALYDDLRDGDEGIDLAGFLKPLYFLQHHGFTLLDAKAVFDVVKGNAKPQLNLREYGTALTKVAKLKYTANPRTVARLVGDIDAFRKRTQLDSFADVVDGVLYDPLRLKLMKPAPLCVLEAYSNVIEQSFNMYCKAPSVATGNVNTRSSSNSCLDLTDEGFYDFLVGYFLSPDYISADTATSIMTSVTSTFAVSHTSATSSSDSSTSSSMVLPQFVEALCRVAQTLHGKLLEDNHGSIRNTIDTCRLEHSIKVMFDTMQVLPNGTTVKSASHVPQKQVQSNLDAMLTDIQSHMGTLSLRTRKVLQRRADDLMGDVVDVTSEAKATTSSSTKPTSSLSSAVDVIVIRDVLAVPDFPPNVVHKVEGAFAYQNMGQYEMALAQLHDAEDELVDVSPFRVLDTDASLFFTLARGNIYDSRQRDLDALQTYAEALAIAESLPESHPGRALALSCLGSVCYYAGNMLVALKCFDKALTLRESLFGEEHVDTATSLNNLACCLHAMGEVDAAAMFFRSVLHVFKLGFGLAHPRISVAMKNLDTAQRHQSRLIQDRAHVKNRDDMKHIIAGSKFQITAFERPTAPLKTKKKKGGKKKK
ncbi:hypothetical protein H257_01082 [Aphanomyces astaci]|uniref:CLU central domain-containing protein n=1 Tax=Aphanomyces astaci TaxID=112090 RepID=W4H7K6_APHAT|nr:hypothetical protein H257_01082 [Aphanomyces astaci]ETV87541.1 hypothetical protein H257_01082 [Aphanomyces astaci]|eukprot:XP_009822404.1 hypothetical protein H257_01082 [Aphanomyces astaci]